MSTRHSLLALIFSVGLVACASPRMESVRHIETPSDPVGMACVQRDCATTLQSCQTSCGEKREVCLTGIKPEQDKAWQDALKHYELALDAWRRDLEFYEFQLWTGWHRGPAWFGPGWYSPVPASTPKAPTRPDRAKVDARVAQDKCDHDCGCQPPYEACLLHCGGRELTEERCVANCPKP